MEKAAVFAVCCFSYLGLTQAHIHSQKVRHFENETLTPTTWLCALLSSALVGVCGVFPLLVNRWVRLDSSCKESLAFRALLSFAVGGLLGDVFLHLLPEAYGNKSGSVGHCFGVGIGLWVMAGLLSFLVVEKVVKMTEADPETCDSTDAGLGAMPNCSADAEALHATPQRCVNSVVFSGNSNSNCSLNGSNGLVMRKLTASDTDDRCPSSSDTSDQRLKRAKCSNSHISSYSTDSTSSPQKDISGYLNLVANSTDNFTHGLAIAASYVASPAVGVLTTLAILCHEIPHEIGDFAILLKSGFSLKEAAKAQVLTASGGLVGVVAGLTAEHVSNASSWLLPFTAGGFLYIALVSIVPELLDCTCLRDSVVQLAFLGLGVMIMALVTIVEKKSCSYMPPHLVTTGS